MRAAASARGLHIDVPVTSLWHPAHQTRIQTLATLIWNASVATLTATQTGAGDGGDGAGGDHDARGAAATDAAGGAKPPAVPPGASVHGQADAAASYRPARSRSRHLTPTTSALKAILPDLYQQFGGHLAAAAAAAAAEADAAAAPAATPWSTPEHPAASTYGDPSTWPRPGGARARRDAGVLLLHGMQYSLALLAAMRQAAGAAAGHDLAQHHHRLLLVCFLLFARLVRHLGPGALLAVAQHWQHPGDPAVDPAGPLSVGATAMPDVLANTLAQLLLPTPALRQRPHVSAVLDWHVAALQRGWLASMAPWPRRSPGDPRADRVTRLLRIALVDRFLRRWIRILTADAAPPALPYLARLPHDHRRVVLHALVRFMAFVPVCPERDDAAARAPINGSMAARPPQVLRHIRMLRSPLQLIRQLVQVVLTLAHQHDAAAAEILATLDAMGRALLGTGTAAAAAAPSSPATPDRRGARGALGLAASVIHLDPWDAAASVAPSLSLSRSPSSPSRPPPPPPPPPRALAHTTGALLVALTVAIAPADRSRHAVQEPDLAPLQRWVRALAAPEAAAPRTDRLSGSDRRAVAAWALHLVTSLRHAEPTWPAWTRFFQTMHRDDDIGDATDAPRLRWRPILAQSTIQALLVPPEPTAPLFLLTTIAWWLMRVPPPRCPPPPIRRHGGSHADADADADADVDVDAGADDAATDGTSRELYACVLALLASPRQDVVDLAARALARADAGHAPSGTRGPAAASAPHPYDGLRRALQRELRHVASDGPAHATVTAATAPRRTRDARLGLCQWTAALTWWVVAARAPPRDLLLEHASARDDASLVETPLTAMLLEPQRGSTPTSVARAAAPPSPWAMAWCASFGRWLNAAMLAQTQTLAWKIASRDPRLPGAMTAVALLADVLIVFLDTLRALHLVLPVAAPAAVASPTATATAVVVVAYPLIDRALLAAVLPAMAQLRWGPSDTLRLAVAAAAARLLGHDTPWTRLPASPGVRLAAQPDDTTLLLLLCAGVLPPVPSDLDTGTVDSPGGDLRAGRRAIPVSSRRAALRRRLQTAAALVAGHADAHLASTTPVGAALGALQRDAMRVASRYAADAARYVRRILDDAVADGRSTRRRHDADGAGHATHPRAAASPSPSPSSSASDASLSVLGTAVWDAQPRPPPSPLPPSPAMTPQRPPPPPPSPPAMGAPGPQGRASTASSRPDRPDRQNHPDHRDLAERQDHRTRVRRPMRRPRRKERSPASRRPATGPDPLAAPSADPVERPTMKASAPWSPLGPPAIPLLQRSARAPIPDAVAVVPALSSSSSSPPAPSASSPVHLSPSHPPSPPPRRTLSPARPVVPSASAVQAVAPTPAPPAAPAGFTQDELDIAELQNTTAPGQHGHVDLDAFLAKNRLVGFGDTASPRMEAEPLFASTASGPDAPAEVRATEDCMNEGAAASSVTADAAGVAWAARDPVSPKASLRRTLQRSPHSASRLAASMQRASLRRAAHDAGLSLTAARGHRRLPVDRDADRGADGIVPPRDPAEAAAVAQAVLAALVFSDAPPDAATRGAPAAASIPYAGPGARARLRPLHPALRAALLADGACLFWERVASLVLVPPASLQRVVADLAASRPPASAAASAAPAAGVLRAVHQHFAPLSAALDRVAQRARGRRRPPGPEPTWGGLTLAQAGVLVRDQILLRSARPLAATQAGSVASVPHAHGSHRFSLRRPPRPASPHAARAASPSRGRPLADDENDENDDDDDDDDDAHPLAFLDLPIA
ncbi:hypothetical protein CXG81DRAFT_17171 [Caulochytrium protostelioides]|uniref:Uncharacterized protein n=1 Tax=Caulochytrium protostelioides TaxID=1555241 RepID=A0A4P9XCZ9_9FUNG|nr:hypothetical protein CXG81DRAFT_17171 [Caulochytrium protostelioides]|eukprot:RKP03322.1 hypothetical protein CXG81DRAFT_17171 [Caulochytrium protostelioides]